MATGAVGEDSCIVPGMSTQIFGEARLTWASQDWVYIRCVQYVLLVSFCMCLCLHGLGKLVCMRMCMMHTRVDVYVCVD